jgi:hypothetical protein
MDSCHDKTCTDNEAVGEGNEATKQLRCNFEYQLNKPSLTADKGWLSVSDAGRHGNSFSGMERGGGALWENCNELVRFKFRRTVVMKNFVVWYMMLSSPLKGVSKKHGAFLAACFRIHSFLSYSSTLKMEVTHFYGMSSCFQSRCYSSLVNFLVV